MSLVINEYENYIQIIRVIYKSNITLMNTVNVNKNEIKTIIL